MWYFQDIFFSPLWIVMKLRRTQNDTILSYRRIGGEQQEDVEVSKAMKDYFQVRISSFLFFTTQPNMFARPWKPNRGLQKWIFRRLQPSKWRYWLLIFSRRRVGRLKQRIWRSWSEEKTILRFGPLSHFFFFKRAWCSNITAELWTDFVRPRKRLHPGKYFFECRFSLGELFDQFFKSTIVLYSHFFGSPSRIWFTMVFNNGEANWKTACLYARNKVFLAANNTILVYFHTIFCHKNGMLMRLSLFICGCL